MFWLWTFLIYGLLFYVATYIIVEVGQNYLYSEITAHAWAKVGVVSLALAAALTWWDPSSREMLADDFGRTVMLAIAAFVLYTLALRFHPPHALMFGPLVVVVVAFTSAMAIDSLKNGDRVVRKDRPPPASARTIRKSSPGSIALPEQPVKNGGAPNP